MSYKGHHSRWKSTFGLGSAAKSSDSGRTSLGSAREHLASELEKVYWQGARDELENIIRTLDIWQRNEFAAASLPNNTHLDEYDTFLDHVNQQARVFAIRYQDERKRTQGVPSPSYQGEAKAIEAVIRDTIAEQSAVKVKAEVRKNVALSKTLSGIEAKAQLLLQTAGFLDIDMMFESPRDQDTAANSPGIPQLVTQATSKGLQIRVLKCARCHQSITGSMFTRKKEAFASATICESCYWAHYYGESSYVKLYKHSIFKDAIELQGTCKCYPAGHVQRGSHVKVKGYAHYDACPLVKIATRMAGAKHEGLLATAGVTLPGQRESHVSRMVHRLKRQSTVGHASRKVVKQETVPKHSSAARATLDEDVPSFYRKRVEREPFNRVHAALRVGPVVIENGSSNGILISLRDLPVYHERLPVRGSQQPVLWMESDPARQLWQCEKPTPKPKHYKLAMKQVVGAPFSGVLSDASDEGQLEQTIIKCLVSATAQAIDPAGLSMDGQRKRMDTILAPMLQHLKTLLAGRLRIYVESITRNLVDQDPSGTNGFQFCSSLLDRSIFGPLVHGPENIDSLMTPLYLISFHCPIAQQYPDSRLLSKYDVPFGFTEEYLHRFYFGRFKDADIIDSLQEYWHDWGSFSGGPLYKYQNMFPWDCSEAWKRCPVKCGGCSIAKHVWAFPFDTWSMITLHLQRDQHLYGPFTEGVPHGQGKISPPDWLQSRYSILAASSALNRVAAAMAQSPRFRKMTAWLHNGDDSPKSILKDHPSLARVKLGGIYRAQPYSHYFELGAGDQYFLSPWAKDDRADQITRYEELRNARMICADIPWDKAKERRYHLAYPENQYLTYVGFNSSGRDNQYYSTSSTNYYPYYHAATNAASVGPGFQCTDAQLTVVDQKAGDENPSFGCDHTCGSGCGSKTEDGAMSSSSYGGGGGGDGGGYGGGYGGGFGSCSGCSGGSGGGGSGGGGSGGGGSGGGGSGGGGSGGGGSGGGGSGGGGSGGG